MMVFARPCARFLCGLLLCSNAMALQFDELNIYTEEFPPYNYTHNGELQGFTVDLLVEATQRIGAPILAKDINVYPWPRSYRILKSEANTVLFSMAYTPNREKLFKWVGPIGKTRSVLLAKKVVTSA